MLKANVSLGLQQTPQLVARVPHIPMLKEHNIRSGFFEHEDFLALRGALPDYAQVPPVLPITAACGWGKSVRSNGGRSIGRKVSCISRRKTRRPIRRASSISPGISIGSCGMEESAVIRSGLRAHGSVTGAGSGLRASSIPGEKPVNAVGLADGEGSRRVEGLAGEDPT